MGHGNGSGRGPGILLGTEVCATLLLLCWLCCWPDDSNSDCSSTSENPGRYPKKPVLFESGSRRRSGEYLSRRIGSSAVSLHLPSTSGYAKTISAHRSHEEIRSRDKTHHENTDRQETRYHSAPSVIDEVLHRRDWDRSTRDLYIPLNPDREAVKCESSPSPDAAPYAEPESSSVECLRPNDHRTNKLCKKHFTNIKSSKGKKCKESNKDDIKDTDATEVEVRNFYIGDEHEDATILRTSPSIYEDHRPSAPSLDNFIEYERVSEERTRSIYKAKDAKQSFNESIRMKEMPKTSLVPVTEGEVRTFDIGFRLMLNDDIDDIDRSGAVHHTIESRMSLRPYPPPSVETVGYEGGACYLAEAGSVSELRARIAESMTPHVAGALTAALEASSLPQPVPLGSLRARHASDGDILAPPHRPESGAFSESDLDLDVDSEEIPPDYNEVQLYASPEKKETAI